MLERIMYQFYSKANILSFESKYNFMKAIKSYEIEQFETTPLTQPILRRVGYRKLKDIQSRKHLLSPFPADSYDKIITLQHYFFSMIPT